MKEEIYKAFISHMKFIKNWLTSPIITYNLLMLGIKDFNINKDDSVDVYGNVNLTHKQLKSIPIQFGIVYGYFDCGYNELTSLKGCPKEIHGYFSCNVNELVSLNYGPKKVYGSYYNCSANKLISLDGYTIDVNQFLYCLRNPIYELCSLFHYNLYLYFDSLDYNYLRGNEIIKFRFQEALEEVGEKLPDAVIFYKYI